MSKRYHVGRAAETGVTAGYFARSNFSGPAYIFEGQWGGFLSTYARHGCEPGALVERLGETYGIMRSGIKPYAACRDIHSTLDVVLGARLSHTLAPDDIMAIKVYCIPEMMQMVGTVVSPRNTFYWTPFLIFDPCLMFVCLPGFYKKMLESPRLK